MTQSVYVIGGAGTGKSTFAGLLLDYSNRSMGPLEDLHQKPNSRGTVITLRGHTVGVDGMYLGCMRDSFPGTDGLDRVSYIPGEEWLQTAKLPEWILAEGATLAVRRFFTVLNEKTDLLIIYLFAEDFIKDLRFMERGSNQDPSFVQATATRSKNLARDMVKLGMNVRAVDSAEPYEWEQALELCADHLWKNS